MNKISIASPVFNGNEKKYLNQCIDTGWISANGKFVKTFEEKFADFCQVENAIACSNGTMSLHLILEAMGIGAKDEVIIPTLTYIATANAVKYCGATPVFAESDEFTWNIDVEKIECKITENTKAIMPVHLYGLPADMDAILKIAEKYNLYVIEDAAEAHGATYKGRKVGSMGHAGSFSFFGNKIITCGEGGMVTTDDKKLADMIKKLRGQGVNSAKRYWHDMVAYNYRMTNMQAAVGLAQLENVDWHMEARKRVANIYQKYLKKIEQYVQVQYVPQNIENAFWMNSIVLKDNVDLSRDEVMRKMEEKYIEMRPLFYPMHIMPPYEDKCVTFPIAEKLASRGMNLPSHAELTEDNIRYIVECLSDIIKCK